MAGNWFWSCTAVIIGQAVFSGQRSRISHRGKIMACVKVCLHCGIREDMSLAESAGTPYE